MKKTRIVSLLLAAVIITAAFTGCDFNINIGSGNKETTKATIGLPSGDGKLTEVTDENGDVIETTGNKQSQNQGGEDEIIPEADDKDIAKQVEKLSEEEVKKNRDFFSVDEDIEKDEKIDEKRLESKQDDEKIITSNVYSISGRMVKDGETTQYKLAQNGNKLSVVTTLDGMPLGFIINGLNVYIVDPEQESYLAIPKSLIESADESGEITSLFDGNPIDTDKKVTKEGTETVDGVELKYKKYDDGTVAYYKDKTIVKTEGADGTVIYYDEISGEAPASLFLPPKGFKRETLNIDNLKKYSSHDGDEDE